MHAAQQSQKSKTAPKAQQGLYNMGCDMNIVCELEYMDSGQLEIMRDISGPESELNLSLCFWANKFCHRYFISLPYDCSIIYTVIEGCKLSCTIIFILDVAYMQHRHCLIVEACWLLLAMLLALWTRIQQLHHPILS